MDAPGSASIPTSLVIRDDASAPMTDFSTIFDAVYNVNQKSGPLVDAPPNRPVPATSVTVVDDSQTSTTVSKKGESALYNKRDMYDYITVFPGTGTGRNDRDAAIEGIAYLTYTLVSNGTYNVVDCLQYCDSVQGCGKLS